MNLSDYKLPTTVTTEINKVNTTVTTVARKGVNYEKTDDLFNQLSDLVNENFKAWYCREFHKLGQDVVLKLAAIARQDARTDRRKYFSWMLKNPGKVITL